MNGIRLQVTEEQNFNEQYKRKHLQFISPKSNSPQQTSKIDHLAYSVDTRLKLIQFLRKPGKKEKRKRQNL